VTLYFSLFFTGLFVGKIAILLPISLRFMPFFQAPTTNQPLVRRAVDPTDEPAWNLLHDTYHAAIVRHCTRSGLSAAEADDISAQVLATLAARLSCGAAKSTPASLRGWLGETTNRLIFEAFRRHRHDQLSAEAMKLIQSWLPPTLAPGTEPASREQLEGHLWNVCLARVRSKVSPRHWQVFEAYALEGRKSGEVAALFNLTDFGVRTIRCRVIVKIRSEWKNLASQPIEIPE
jgi:DNA-directed RNA polymerase specialized sigma24 family protein